jgi:hypothetical protein
MFERERRSASVQSAAALSAEMGAEGVDRAECERWAQCGGEIEDRARERAGHCTLRYNRRAGPAMCTGPTRTPPRAIPVPLSAGIYLPGSGSRRVSGTRRRVSHFFGFP